MSVFARFRAPAAVLSNGSTASGVRVKKAVLPVAGMGTRFLPATKAIAKEMLPIVDRPLIQYAVDEAVAAGIEEIIIVTNRSKRSIEDYFDEALELEAALHQAGKHDVIKSLHALRPDHVTFHFVRQPRPQGLGDAVYCARHLLGNDPFAVLLPDDLIDGTPPVLAQMATRFSRSGCSLLAVEEVPMSQCERYGIVDIDPPHALLATVRDVVEKPSADRAPSNLVVVGRYIFTPAILSCLENLPPGRNGEVQLTDAIARLSKREVVQSYRYMGRRYDCGTKVGFLEATLAYGLKHPECGADLQQLIAARAAASVPATSPTIHRENLANVVREELAPFRDVPGSALRT